MNINAKYEIQIKLVLIVLAVLFSQSATCQEEIDDKTKALGLEYGFGAQIIKDKYISDNNYNGSKSLFRINWNSKHEKYYYVLNFTYTKSIVNSGIVKAYAREVDFNQGFIYKLNYHHKKASMYLGPMFDFYFHYRTHPVAANIISRPYSGALLVSASLFYRVEYRMADRIRLQNDLSSNVLSLASRLPDFTLEESKFVKIQSVFSTTLLNNSFLLGYSLNRYIIMNLKYHFQLLNFTGIFSNGEWEDEGWSNIFSVSNQFIIGVTLNF